MFAARLLMLLQMLTMPLFLAGTGFRFTRRTGNFQEGNQVPETVCRQAEESVGETEEGGEKECKEEEEVNGLFLYIYH
jgi:hypothetical protein